jgi:hypothetical protein
MNLWYRHRYNVGAAVFVIGGISAVWRGYVQSGVSALMMSTFLMSMQSRPPSITWEDLRTIPFLRIQVNRFWELGKPRLVIDLDGWATVTYGLISTPDDIVEILLDHQGELSEELFEPLVTLAHAKAPYLWSTYRQLPDAERLRIGEISEKRDIREILSELYMTQRSGLSVWRTANSVETINLGTRTMFLERKQAIQKLVAAGVVERIAETWVEQIRHWAGENLPETELPDPVAERSPSDVTAELPLDPIVRIARSILESLRRDAIHDALVGQNRLDKAMEQQRLPDRPAFKVKNRPGQTSFWDGPPAPATSDPKPLDSEHKSPFGESREALKRLELIREALRFATPDISGDVFLKEIIGLLRKNQKEFAAADSLLKTRRIRTLEFLIPELIEDTYSVSGARLHATGINIPGLNLSQWGEPGRLAEAFLSQEIVGLTTKQFKALRGLVYEGQNFAPGSEALAKQDHDKRVLQVRGPDAIYLRDMLRLMTRDQDGYAYRQAVIWLLLFDRLLPPAEFKTLANDEPKLTMFAAGLPVIDVDEDEAMFKTAIRAQFVETLIAKFGLTDNALNKILRLSLPAKPKPRAPHLKTLVPYAVGIRQVTPKPPAASLPNRQFIPVADDRSLMTPVEKFQWEQLTHSELFENDRTLLETALALGQKIFDKVGRMVYGSRRGASYGFNTRKILRYISEIYQSGLAIKVERVSNPDNIAKLEKIHLIFSKPFHVITLESKTGAAWWAHPEPEEIVAKGIPGELVDIDQVISNVLPGSYIENHHTAAAVALILFKVGSGPFQALSAPSAWFLLSISGLLAGMIVLGVILVKQGHITLTIHPRLKKAVIETRRFLAAA